MECIVKNQCNVKTVSPDHERLQEFDWTKKWLRGDEYHHILTHAELYINVYNFAKYPPKTHPPTTYTDPIGNLILQIDGSIYFVEGLSVGSEFGFPRGNIPKIYKWYLMLNVRKKMNFSTDLPKSKPMVNYIVASAMKSARFRMVGTKEGPCFRMHAVILKNPRILIIIKYRNSINIE